MKTIIDINGLEFLINSFICSQTNHLIVFKTKEPIYICYNCCGRYQIYNDICEKCKKKMEKKSLFIIRHDNLSSLHNNKYTNYDLLTNKYISVDISKIYYLRDDNKEEDEYFIVNI